MPGCLRMGCGREATKRLFIGAQVFWLCDKHAKEVQAGLHTLEKDKRGKHNADG